MINDHVTSDGLIGHDLPEWELAIALATFILMCACCILVLL